MNAPAPRPAGLSDPSAERGASLRRLRWRARRGLLENDLLIGRYLDARGRSVGPAEADALGRLLELPDQVLLELLLGREEPGGELDTPAVREVLSALRAVRLQPRGCVRSSPSALPLLPDGEGEVCAQNDCPPFCDARYRPAGA